MIYGLHLSGQGAQIQSLRQDVLANNLANASTNAFKRDLVRAQSHAPLNVPENAASRLAGNLYNLPGGVSPMDVVTDFSVGQMVPTKGPFDVAISGKGFFRVNDGKQQLLTRDGQLSLTNDGRLVTREHGYAVLASNNTPINGLDPALPVQFQPDGTVIQDGKEVAKLAVVEPASYAELEKTGNNTYLATGRTNPASPDVEIKQGFVEGSGTSPVTEMMQLIEAARTFEANVNMIKHQDDALGRLLQGVPRK